MLNAEKLVRVQTGVNLFHRSGEYPYPSNSRSCQNATLVMRVKAGVNLFHQSRDYRIPHNNAEFPNVSLGRDSAPPDHRRWQTVPHM